MLWWWQILCFYQVFIIVTSTPVSVLLRQPGSSDDMSNIEEEEDEGSDDGLYNKRFIQGDIYPHRSRAIPMGASEEVSLWPDGVIIYRLDEKIGCPDSPQCQVLMKAMNHYHTHTCIRFQEWTGEESYVRIFYNPNSGECWSAVGKQGGQQYLSLGRRCWYQGIVIHELGHSVGFEHEMNRPDRDDYININWENIKPGFAAAFEKLNIDNFKSFNEDFDYKSIMMYDEFAFSKDKHSPTISAKDKSIIGPIWRKPGLSEGDIRRIKKMYSCGNNEQLMDKPSDVICTFNRNACGFKNSVNKSWRWNQVNDKEGYVYTTPNTSRTTLNEKTENEISDTTGYFVSVNFYGVSKNSGNLQMGCVRFWYLTRGDENVYLKLRQSYLSRTTQLNYIEEDTFDLWESEGRTQEWDYVEIPLYISQPFKLIFESSPGSSISGLIALDDFQLSFVQCSSSNTQKS